MEQDSAGSTHYYRVPYTTDGDFDVDRALWTELTFALNAYEILALTSVANYATVGNVPVADWFQYQEDVSALMAVDVRDSAEGHSFEFHFDSPTTWRFWEKTTIQTGVGLTR